MLSRKHHATIFTMSMFMLLLLKDLLAKFIISCTIKDQRATCLCLVKGNLASLHDLVSFQVEQMKCSRVSSLTKENTIDRPSIKLIQILALLYNKAYASENMEMTHLRSATMHQLIACLLLESSEKNLVRHIPHVIDGLSPKPPWSPMLTSSGPFHTMFCFSFHHAILGVYTDLKNRC
jgi:hypothetical protein